MATDQAITSAPLRRDGSGQMQSQNGPPGALAFSQYQTQGFYDEMFDEAGRPRPECQPLYQRIRSISADDLIRRQRAADRSMVQLGITFNVYGDRQGSERIIPFDIVPRIVGRDEWSARVGSLRRASRSHGAIRSGAGPGSHIVERKRFFGSRREHRWALGRTALCIRRNKVRNWAV